MKKIASIFLILCCSAFKIVFASDIPMSEKELKKGQEIYHTHCSLCHGANGDGKGKAAVAIKNPKPCNFTVGEFKHGSNLEQIKKTIEAGVPGTAMPAWKNLSDEEKTAVGKYILKMGKKNH